MRRLGLALDGSSNLYSNVDKLGVQSAAVIFAGAGLVSADTISRQQAATQFAGAGALSVTVSAPYAIQVRFAGAGNISNDSIKYKLAAATFAGIGNLSVNYSIVKFGEIRFDGSIHYQLASLHRCKVRPYSADKDSCARRLSGEKGQDNQRAPVLPVKLRLKEAIYRAMKDRLKCKRCEG